MVLHNYTLVLCHLYETNGLYNVQYDCDLSRKYTNINLGLPGGDKDGNNMTGWWRTGESNSGHGL